MKIKHEEPDPQIKIKINIKDTRYERDDDKFNESFEKELLYWKNASENLSNENFEKLIEDEIIDEPFVNNEDITDEDIIPNNQIDFEKYETLFKKADTFWGYANNCFSEEEYGKLVGIYVESDQITWSTLTSDVFLAEKTPQGGSNLCSVQSYQQHYQNQSNSNNNPVKQEPAENMKYYTCTECHNSFSSQETLQTHMASHAKKKVYKCKVCTSWFTSEDEIESHKAYFHTEDVKPFLCDLCRKTFKTNSQLKIHKDFSHTEDLTLSCNFCKRIFKQFDALQKHRLVHQL